MSLRFYFDEHVDRPIAQGLRQRGIDVLTVQEDGRDTLADPALLDRALELGRVMVTFDDDHLAEARRRQVAGIPFAGVAFLHQATVRQAIELLEVMAGVYELDDMMGRVEYLPF